MAKISRVALKPWDVLSIVARFKQIRVEKQMTAKEVSLLAGMPKNYLNRIESGAVKRPTPQLLKRIAKALDVDFIEILTTTIGMPTDFNARLNWIRLARGMNRKTLSQKSGIPFATIYDIENRVIKTPELSIVSKLAKGLSVKLYDLFGDHDLVSASQSWKETGPVEQLRAIVTEQDKFQRQFEAGEISARLFYAKTARLTYQISQLVKLLPHSNWPLKR